LSGFRALKYWLWLVWVIDLEEIIKVIVVKSLFRVIGLL
jgi:hypothetical protein